MDFKRYHTLTGLVYEQAGNSDGNCREHGFLQCPRIARGVAEATSSKPAAPKGHFVLLPLRHLGLSVNIFYINMHKISYLCF